MILEGGTTADELLSEFMLFTSEVTEKYHIHDVFLYQSNQVFLEKII